VEVSGFPSSYAGHLVLLSLKDQDYPGTSLIEEWPSWNLPILRWARAQGAVAGYGHCGDGLVVDTNDLPNYDIPPMDVDGANEAIVDVTHGMLDFLSGCDGPPTAELNVWYHLLNCGFRLPMLGETDFPCLSDLRPGAGRTYVQLGSRPIGNSGYRSWINGLKSARLYCGDGRSHFLSYGIAGQGRDLQEVTLKRPSTITVEALVAARLEPEPPEDLQQIKRRFLNGWHLENARIGTSREVRVELVVNGQCVDQANFLADGTPQTLRFSASITHSSWLALRIFPSSHIAPFFVTVRNKPIRASQRSAKWCRVCVDKLWADKAVFIRTSERAAALAAYDHARRTYDAIALESEVT
jgi:hypothetical protein